MNGIKKIAIVILNWNGEKLLDKFLPSILHNHTNDLTKIVVADNDSTDNSITLLQNKYPSVEIIKLDKNYGFAEGYNRALTQIEAEYYVLINSDVEVTPDWLTPCLSIMEEDKNVAAVQPKILNYNKPHLFEYAGAAGGFIDFLGYPFCRGRILNNIEADIGQYDQTSKIFWASGACMVIQSSKFWECGGFDGSFWAHMEEIDLCWRLKSRGYQIAYQPKSSVFHLGGATLSYKSPRKVYLNFRNNLFMIFKNLPPRKFLKLLILRLILDIVAAFKFLVGFHLSSFVAVMKAHISFFSNIPQLKRERKRVQADVIVDEHAEIFKQSIMWNFFIRKKQLFSDLSFRSTSIMKSDSKNS